MFALEIDFHDGISPPETILVRRSSAIVGSSEFAHIVIEGTASSQCELRLTRGLGREFVCQPVRKAGQTLGTGTFMEGVYSGEAEMRLGDITAYITSLDLDLQVAPDEAPDRAGLRVLRSAVRNPIPMFPAVAVLGEVPAFLSFPESQPLVIGRSRKCGLRLNASDVSGEHARVGYENGEFWVEDLGSTNGTFVGDERISGRRFLKKMETVGIGAEFKLAVVSNGEDAAKLSSQVNAAVGSSEEPDAYPCVLSNSDLVRPSRYVFGGSNIVTVGRDPSNDIWIGAVHISRRHLEIHRTGAASISVIDLSSNGSYADGERLPSGTLMPLTNGLAVLDLCSGIVLAICSSRDEEDRFILESPEGDSVHGGGQGMRADSDEELGVGNGNTAEPNEVAESVASESPDETLLSGGPDSGTGSLQKFMSRQGELAANSDKDGDSPKKQQVDLLRGDLLEPNTGLAALGKRSWRSILKAPNRSWMKGCIFAGIVVVASVAFLFMHSVGDK